MSVLLSAHEIKKAFGHRLLFEGVSFHLHSGERVGLIGPNGAGKSTLLEVIAGAAELDEGELVLTQGVRIGYLRQTPQLRPEDSIFEALLKAAEHQNDPAATALEMFRKVGLHELGRPVETKVGELSGGWQKRVALGAALAQDPQLLLLDEPTNHLDIESILWLENYLSRAPFSILTVTHDRAFLQNTCNRILELDRRNPGGLLSVDGDYAKYVERKEELLQTQQQQETSLKNRLRRETEWLRRGAKARTTKQKARIDRAGELAGEVADLSERNRSTQVQIQFDGTDRKTKRLLEAKSISKEFNGRPLFRHLNLFLGPGSRVGLLGKNGSGKTTLIRTLLGQYKPDSGEIFRAENLLVAYFEQQRESLNPEATVMQTVCPEGDHVKFQGKFVHVRSYLGKFLFSGPQCDQPVSRLSGGEQARLLIARLMLQPADILVLDEPTNDLDMAMLDVLEDCLEGFPGAVILVTHDRYFLDRVSHQILGFDEASGLVTSYSEVAQWQEALKNRTDAPKSQGPTPSPPTKNRPKKKLSYKEERELESMESTILEKEDRLEALNREAQQKASQAMRLAEIYEEIGQLQKEIETLYARWQELENLRASFN